MSAADRTRDVGSLNLVATFLSSFPPFARLAQERELASLGRVRKDGLLTVSVEPAGALLMVRAEGELDIASARLLEEEVREAIDSGASTVVLDLSGLDFIDSTGIRVLLSVAEHASRTGDRLRMLHGSERVENVLDLSGVAPLLPLAD
jgi:anti-sigma B factor antagonist